MVYDVYPEAMSKLHDAGAHTGHSPAEVADKSDTIISMLPNSNHVMDVYTGVNGILE
jgi:3-hydroxyisobutyrate dehydrogenase-like beta-hydroxyacid dehydrogenase